MGHYKVQFIVEGMQTLTVLQIHRVREVDSSAQVLRRKNIGGKGTTHHL